MFDAYQASNPQKPTTALMKKILEKTQTSCSPYNALKIPKTLKKLKMKEKM